MKWIPGIIGAIVGAALMTAPAVIFGKRLARDQAAIDASKKAVERIQALEKNNANFSKLPARDRCLLLMRDSGLPDSACD